MQRGQHDINDELIFTNHDGYVFHDSRGFEAGSKDELETVQEFVKSKSQQTRLRDRLHAIWFVFFVNLQLSIHKATVTFQVLHSYGQRSAIAGFKVL
jgi:hypothetical protein